MPSLPKLVVLPDEVDTRLHTIGGLTRAVLTHAGVLGEQARENTPRSFPVTAPGTNAYFARVGSLRDQLRPFDWKGECVGGSELTIAPDRGHAIVVAAGDDNTASLTATPRTKTKKGRRMKDAAKENRGQISLFPTLSVANVGAVKVAVAEGAPWLTWVFLVARFDNNLLMELSLVGGLDADRRGAHWIERILLPAGPLDGGMGTGISVAPRAPTPSPEIVVNVTRKTGS